MAQRFHVEEQWPELFDVLTEEQRHSVVATLIAGWHEGWEPTREDVENLSDFSRGAITGDEYSCRVRESAGRERSRAG